MAKDKQDPKEDTVKIELELPESSVSIEGPGGPAPEEKSGKKTKEEESNPDQDKESGDDEGSGEDEDSKSKKDEKSDGEPKILGYKASELAKLPAEPPEPSNKEPANPAQTKIILTGFVVIVIGVICWIFLPFFVGLAIAIAGAILIALGTLGRFD